MEKCEEQLWWAQPCSNIPSKQEERGSELNPQAGSPVLAVGQTPESVQCLSSPLARVLPGLGDGIHIALLLLRGSAKWPWGKQHQWRILLDLDPFWQAFINVSFKTEALLPLYFIYILWGSRWTANSDCYKKRSSIIWGKFTWHLLSQLRPAIPTCLCCFCKRTLQAVNTLSFRVLVLT